MTDLRYIKAYVRPEEKAEVTALAKQARITVSELVKRCTLGRKLPNANRHKDIVNLIKINADQARLGNLLRMALMEEDFIVPDGLDLESLFDGIRETQDELKSKIKDLKNGG